MHRSRSHWLPAVLCSLTALFGALSVRPALAARSTTPIFYEGSTTGDQERTAWFAAYGGKLFGSLVDTDIFGSDRLYSRRITRGKFNGTIFNENNRAIGSISGTQSPISLVGRYTLTGVGTGDFAGTPVARSAAGTRAIAATYTSAALRAQHIDLSLKFSTRGELTGAAYANAGSFRLKVASLTGRFLVDTNGFLWILAQKASYAKVSGGPSISLPKQGIPVKLGIRRSGRQLDLLNPFDSSDVLTTLTRK